MQLMSTGPTSAFSGVLSSASGGYMPLNIPGISDYLNDAIFHGDGVGMPALIPQIVLKAAIDAATNRSIQIPSLMRADYQIQVMFYSHTTNATITMPDVLNGDYHMVGSVFNFVIKGDDSSSAVVNLEGHGVNLFSCNSSSGVTTIPITINTGQIRFASSRLTNFNGTFYWLVTVV